MKLQLQLLSLEHFHSSTLQVVLQKIHDIVIWSFPFHRNPTTSYFFFWFYSFPHIISS
jgi:hypothetical protein